MQLNEEVPVHSLVVQDQGLMEFIVNKRFLQPYFICITFGKMMPNKKQQRSGADHL
jgi:hypothetical protein